MSEAEQEWRRQYLEAPDPLAQVPSRYLSAQGFAERLLRLIEEHLREGATPDVILAHVSARCERLVFEGDGHGR